MSIHITANRETCIGAGQCVFADPDAFDQDDDGIVLVIRAEPTTADEIARARDAVQVCPSRSLTLTETA